KTTTTTLAAAMLRHGQARPVFVGGNIGQPLLERLGEISSDAWVVLELSSFQLEWLRMSPLIAAVTNITPNHLDRHETMNACIAHACGVGSPHAIGEAIRRFRGVPHRLQLVEESGDVRFYDDSIATSPARTLAALAALDRPVVVILGGRDKHLPWTDLARVVAEQCRGAVLIGEAAPLVRRALEDALAASGAGPAHCGPAGHCPTHGAAVGRAATPSAAWVGVSHTPLRREM